VIRCSICQSQNAELAQVCRQCGAALDASPPTIAIPDGGAPRADHAAAAATVAAPREPSPSHGFAPGSVIADRYRVVLLLGRGGMGEVYGADDLKLGQRVALKFLPSEHGKSASWRDQFYAEVRMARQVSHPNVCRVYDVGESEGMLFLSMEFVDGEDLESLLRRIGRLPEDKAVEVAQQLCAGLAAAHRSGVLHRDLKPSNVMIDGMGRARITDFGLAVAAAEATQGTGPAGTPGYLAPELLEGAGPSVQSDLYALGLVLYELFTGKRAFQASSLGEFHRKQTETNPTPPSSVVKNFDPAVERAILRCLDRDPSQRPRSALSIAAALPGGDPLATALAAGETPSPEMVAAAGPSGSLRPAVAWACLVATVVLILGASMFLAPHATDWGLAFMNKSPEVLADRAQELAKKLGYPTVVDRTFWVGSERDYLDYVAYHPSGKDWKRTLAEQAWPSPVSFWYRQSPQWMMPYAKDTRGPPAITRWDPPYETPGMVTVKLDTQGKLLFLRGVPQRVQPATPGTASNWDLLFAEAGLDKARFAPAPPKWVSPEPFDSQADWEGQLADVPDVTVHITAAAYQGVPVYFQVIAPWDDPAASSAADLSSLTAEIYAAIGVSLPVAYLVVGGLFARWNLRRGRGDAKGALRLASFTVLAFGAWALFGYHFVPRPEYIGLQFLLLGIPLFFGLLTWIGYMAAEPYVRQRWPKLLVSWQRLLSGRFRDPLVGRDVLLGVFAGSVAGTLFLIVAALSGLSEINRVDSFYGQGVWPSIGYSISLPAGACVFALSYLALLAILTRLIRWRWLGLTALGLIQVALFSPTNAVDLAATVLYVLAFLAVLTRIGLVAALSFQIISLTLGFSPPLQITQWYAGRAVIALLIPLTLLVWGFYVSLGGQPMFGSALKEDT
jgi:serine/threonine-protein kinase